MSKKDALATVTILPMQTQHDAKRLLPVELMDTKKFFKKLSPAEQTQLMDETKQLGAAILTQGAAALSIGKHLSEINELLTKHNAFYAYLKMFKIEPTKAYRYMNGYNNAMKMLPPEVVKAAMIRGVPIMSKDAKRPLGEYTAAFKALPPPRNPDSERAAKYIEEIEVWRKDRKDRVRKSGGKLKPSTIAGEIEYGDPDELAKSAYRAVVLYFKKLPGRAPKKQEWLETLFGRTLNACIPGVTSMNVKAQASPEGYDQGRGRPKLVKDDETATAATA